MWFGCVFRVVGNVSFKRIRKTKLCPYNFHTLWIDSLFSFDSFDCCKQFLASQFALTWTQKRRRRNNSVKYKPLHEHKMGLYRGHNFQTMLQSLSFVLLHIHQKPRRHSHFRCVGVRLARSLSCPFAVCTAIQKVKWSFLICTTRCIHLVHSLV